MSSLLLFLRIPLRIRDLQTPLSHGLTYYLIMKKHIRVLRKPEEIHPTLPLVQKVSDGMHVSPNSGRAKSFYNSRTFIPAKRTTEL